MLIAVPSTWSDEQPYRTIGHFELLSSANINDESTQEATISPRNCPGGVTDANPDKYKNSISVDWVAPRYPQGCVSFRYIFLLIGLSFFYSYEYRATVVRSDTTWFKDENALTYTMCEDRLYSIKNNHSCIYNEILYLFRNVHEKNDATMLCMW